MDAAAVPTHHEGRKHLQRLIRKVRHVLIVKHCIDDLKGGTELRLCQEDLGRRHEILTELPDGKDSITDLHVLDGDFNELDSTVDRNQPTSLVTDSLSKSVSERLLEVVTPKNNLRSVETQLDSFIANAVEIVQRCKERFIPPALDFWIRWAKKRGASVLDHRARDVLTKYDDECDDEVKKLHKLEGTLDDYITGSYGRVPESLSDVVHRLRAVFGVGWFFEWPSGRHPLNSTWPWVDVKPSLVVLWGVCWMFSPTYSDSPTSDQDFRFPCPPPYNNSFVIPQYPAEASQPVTFSDATYFPTMPPGSPSATIQQSRPTQLTMQGFMPGQDGIGSPYWPLNSQDFSSHSGYSAQSPRNASPRGLGTAWDIRHRLPNHASHAVNDRYSRPTTRDVAQPDSWMIQPENSAQPYKAATPRTINTTRIHSHLLPLYPSASSILAPMPSSTAFSYPPLDNMNDMHDPRPYMVEQERAYNQMPDPHDYEHHHDPQQDQPRYPTPPPPLSENPYNAQQATGETPDSRMEMPIEQKSESDAASPGRSKPVPKPDREVTKDANGRFYCNWVGCTEEVKDFGRKCEWSKHMDKHDRPYKCPAEGCEKLPGFTYSGGLLRHEREVHNKHGGPRKQLNCPHLNCKRHTGKGFSRQENLNEHLRRVHTDAGLPLNGEETEDDASEAQVGGKRKRTRGESADLREEMKRLKQENEELRRQAEAQTQQSAEMMRQILQLQQAQQIQATMQHPRMQAPPAQMT